jgi:hypothetical protein
MGQWKVNLDSLQDKQAILSNNSGSEGFNKFVDGLGG